MAYACFYACLITSGHAPKSVDRWCWMGTLLPDLEQGIIKLLDSLRCDPATLDLGQASMTMVSIPSSYKTTSGGYCCGFVLYN